MGMRRKILAALDRQGMLTIDDLITATGEPRKRLADNLSATVQSGLCTRERDDITNQPAYKITAAGREWMLKSAPVGTDPGAAAPAPAKPAQAEPTPPAAAAEPIAAAAAGGVAQENSPSGGSVDIDTYWAVRHAGIKAADALIAIQSALGLPGGLDKGDYLDDIQAAIRRQNAEIERLAKASFDANHKLVGAEAAGRMLQSVIEQQEADIEQLKADLAEHAAQRPRFYASTSSTGGMKRHEKRESAERRAAGLVARGDTEALVLIPIARACRGAVLKAL